MSGIQHRVCPHCGYNSPSTIECARCGIVFDKFKMPTKKRTSDLIFEELAKRDRANRELFKDPKINILALPFAVAFSFIVYAFWPLRAIGYFTSIIPLHEMGHAVTSWIGGRFAFPAGALVPSAAMTFGSTSRSPIFSIFFLATVLFITYRAWLEKLWFALAVCFAAIASSIYFTGMISEIHLNAWISYGGIAGEFILGSALILAFYNPLFEKLRWDYFRYPFLLMGTNAYVNAMITWHRIQARTESIPFGSAVSSDGSGDSSGDMNKLIAGGWTESEIISRYLMLGKICFVLILAQYLYSAWRSQSDKS